MSCWASSNSCGIHISSLFVIPRSLRRLETIIALFPSCEPNLGWAHPHQLLQGFIVQLRLWPPMFFAGKVIIPIPKFFEPAVNCSVVHCIIINCNIYGFVCLPDATAESKFIENNYTNFCISYISIKMNFSIRRFTSRVKAKTYNEKGLNTLSNGMHYGLCTDKISPEEIKTVKKKINKKK